jgi:DNA-directed RNA polymerase specialized sigma24 family protein
MTGPAAPTDDALVASVLDGDDDAFAELARRHKRKIFGMAARFFDNSRACELIRYGFSRLSPPERLVLTLLELEGHTVREISQATGWSEANVKVRAFRARSSLKQILESRHE